MEGGSLFFVGDGVGERGTLSLWEERCMARFHTELFILPILLILFYVFERRFFVICRRPINGIMSRKRTCTVALVSCLVDPYSRSVRRWMYLNALEMRRSPCKGCGAFCHSTRGQRDGRQCLENVASVLMQAIRRS